MATVKTRGPTTVDSRELMVKSAAARIGTHGVSATSFSDVVDHSGAPRGSIYHHFPGGKRELAEEAVRWVGDQVLAHQRACEATTPSGVLVHFVALFRQVVRTSKGTAGCAVAGVAVDTGTDDAEQLRVVRSVFRAWIGLLAEQLEGAGLPAERARSVAIAALASVEGALILCRAEGTTAPLEAVGDELARLVRPVPRKRAVK
jgi:TetR/AcrR family transcriptional regulator, lmrAB and yxaGH operons repressor